MARELAVAAADLSGWGDALLEVGAASLKSRAREAASISVLTEDQAETDRL